MRMVEDEHGNVISEAEWNDRQRSKTTKGGSEPFSVTADSGAYKTNPHSDTKTNSTDDVVTAKSIQRSNKERTYTARATVLGNPHLKANTLIEINGVGKKFGGKWWVKSVTHKINSSGYICDLELQRDALGTKDGDLSGKKSGAVTPANTSGNGGSSGSDSSGDRFYIDAETGEHGKKKSDNLNYVPGSSGTILGSYDS